MRDELLPFSDVDCDAIAAMLAPQFTSKNMVPLQFVFGSAMARVLAHQVYHIELNTPLHSVCSIAKSAFGAGELFGPELRFEPAQIQRIAALGSGQAPVWDYTT